MEETITLTAAEVEILRKAVREATKVEHARLDLEAAYAGSGVLVGSRLMGILNHAKWVLQDRNAWGGED